MRNVVNVTLSSCLYALIVSGCSASGAQQGTGGYGATLGTGGATGSSCATGLTLCNGTCVGLTSDSNNCGQCGSICQTGTVCSSGTCQSSCGTGLTLCGQSCANLASDATHCGSCSTTCPTLSNCSNSQCQAVATGGSPGAGGATSQGATANSTGGSNNATGGMPATGGVPATGGAPVIATDCTEVATGNGVFTKSFQNTTVGGIAGTTKNYVITANWWHQFVNQTVAYNGNSYTIGGTASSSPDTSPSGFPSIFIGNYGNSGTSTGSNLPKPVTSLTTIPTYLASNASSTSGQFNVTYDVWFNPNGTVDTTNGNPGTGGYYLMVWLFQPTGFQPRGASISGQAQSISGVSGSWRVWSDGQNGSQPPCVSYVAATNIDSLDFDLNDFIKDARNRGYISSSQQLALIFGGTEIWNGAVGLQIQRFCAIVN